MNRYKSTKKHTNKGAYKTTILPKIPEKASDLYIISRAGDRLDLLANEFYQDVSKWWVIAEANNIINGTIVIEPGLQLRIPNPIFDINDLLQHAEETR
jgi:nucleoid-associated protein YgaU